MHTFKLPKALPPNSISKCVPVCQVDRRISYRHTVNPSILNPPTVYVQHHMTDDRTPSQKDDCIWGRAVGFAAGWLEVGTVFEGFHWADWSHLFYPALPHTAPTARTACPTPNTSFSSEASPASSAPSRHPRLIQGHCRSLLTHAVAASGHSCAPGSTGGIWGYEMLASAFLSRLLASTRSSQCWQDHFKIICIAIFTIQSLQSNFTGNNFLK